MRYYKAKLLLVGVGLFLSNPNIAVATKTVDSPVVESHELVIGVGGQVDFDRRDSKNNEQLYKYSVGYSFVDHWFTEFAGESAKVADSDNFEFTALEWTNRFQLLEQEKHWLNAGLSFSYQTTVEEKTADMIEAKILLEKSLGKFTHIANIILEKEVGGGTHEQTAGGFAWSSSYHLNEYFQPGIELHSDYGELRQNLAYTKQAHQLGPVFYGKIGERVNYDIGYLFALTDPAPEGELKFILEYAQKF